MKVIENKEQQEAAAMEPVIARLCKHYGFENPRLSYGDLNGKLVFVLAGKTPNSPEPQSVLGIIDK